MTQLADLTTVCSPTWCPGCGDMAIWAAFKNAAVEKDWNSSNTVLTAGIGCHGHILNFTKFNSFEGLHGRALPVATGMKMANNRLNSFVFTGDGDCLAEGGNHFIHTCRRNHDITIVLHDNAIYALTTGQTSPLSPHGLKTKSTPDGNLDMPLNPLTLAITAGATFVAREYASHINEVKELMIKAAEHKGTALVDILQPCVTFNELYTHEFYQQNTYKLGEDHDKGNKEQAFKKALEWGEKQIPLGIFYEEQRPTYEEQINQIKDKPLVDERASKKDIQEIFDRYV
jgi:2-oxoglutarate ferredoxin oxidoreductase subunit beta